MSDNRRSGTSHVQGGVIVQRMAHSIVWLLVLLIPFGIGCRASGDVPSSAISGSVELTPSVTADASPTVETVIPTLTPAATAAVQAADPETDAVDAADAADAADAVAASAATPSDDAPTPSMPAPPPREHVVSSGDTLLGLAIAFDVPMAAIQLRNDLGASKVVQVGQRLVIPSGEAWSHASPFWMVHEVAEGETLGEIVQAYDLSQDEVLAVNDLPQADVLSVGQPLVLPLDGPTELAAVRPTATVPPPTATPVPPAVVPEVETAALGPTTAPTPTVTPNPPSQAPADAAPPETAPPEAAPGMAALAQETFRLINEQRAAHGLPPLRWNAVLAGAAQRHAEDCYQRGWCSHTGSDGSSYRTRMIRAGYNPARWSECWAWYGSPQRAVAMWMDEVPPNDPHRRTILSDYLLEVGVGVMPGNGHGYYFIADFGTPK